MVAVIREIIPRLQHRRLPDNTITFNDCNFPVAFSDDPFPSLNPYTLGGAIEYSDEVNEGMRFVRSRIQSGHVDNIVNPSRQALELLVVAMMMVRHWLRVDDE